ncbi:hypothetical protein E6C60_1068 [Paenibacillus algicola]|uniref:YdbS-like PH domain-containing protein n=1 Tax=Paenibacillus algicola TaxID=2565926 RepID=A0A4P8XH10_9BACL|nr:PH domain-containing protein [Paenibacillus algicola]QCT01786.1 hypothetical protein E6C60_1068 [Paenibacillus algicola]
MSEHVEALQRCHPDTVKVYRIYSIGGSALFLLLAAAYLYLAGRQDWPLFPGWAALAGTLPAALWLVLTAPRLWHETFGFRVSAEQLEISSGIFFMRDTIIPMTRVQHVELESGPLLRRYGLAELKVVTAAKSHVIRALSSEEAERLKAVIGKLAQVVDEDV